MFDMKKLALAGALAMIAAAATAAQPGHLADRHAARSVDCAACHAVKTRPKAPKSTRRSALPATSRSTPSPKRSTPAATPSRQTRT